MKPNRVEISPERLFQASEAVVLAATEVARRTNAPVPFPTELIGTPHEPQCLKGFARDEIQEACDFLVRLGILQKMPRSTGHAGPGGAPAS